MKETLWLRGKIGNTLVLRNEIVFISADTQIYVSDLEDEAGFSTISWRQKHGRIPRKVVAGTEDLSRAILKLAWSKGPTFLRAQVNI